jgi:hypothetical protein
MGIVFCNVCLELGREQADAARRALYARLVDDPPGARLARTDRERVDAALQDHLRSHGRLNLSRPAVRLMAVK